MPQVSPAHQAPADDALEYLTRLRKRANVHPDDLAFAERNFERWQAASDTLDLISTAAKSMGVSRMAAERMTRLALLAPHRRHLLKAGE